MTMTILAGPTQIGVIPTGSLSAADKAALEGLEAQTAGAQGRTGLSPSLFTNALSGLPSNCTPLDPSQCAQSKHGPVYRVTGAFVIATRALGCLPPNSFFALQAMFRRSQDPTDPNNDALRVGIQWLDGNAVAISQTIVSQISYATVASGLQILTVRVPSKTGDLVQITPPRGAVFWRPFVQSFGSDGQTDVVCLSVTDVTNSGVFAPDIAALSARVSNIESRLDHIPARVQNKSANYTVVTTDDLVLGNALAGEIVFTLPPAASCMGKRVAVKKIDSSANSVTLKGANSELIDGSNTLENIIRYASNSVESDGTQWWII